MKYANISMFYQRSEQAYLFRTKNRNNNFDKIKTFESIKDFALNNSTDNNIEAILINYKNPILKYFYSYLKNQDDCEDLYQEFSINVANGIKNFRKESTLKTWLYKIAHNTLISSFRKKKIRTFELDNKIIDDSSTPEQLTIAKEMETSFWAIIYKMPEKYRTVFLLKELFNLKYIEIAEILDWRLGTVQSRLSDARKYIHKNLTILNFTSEDYYE